MNQKSRLEDGHLAEYFLRLGDDRLVLGHRLSEWCAHAPIPEEDIAVSNIALDLIGHASLLLSQAGRLEGKNRDEDDLAFWRDVTEFRNCLLVEQPNGDFAETMMRQYLFDVYGDILFAKLKDSTFRPLAEIAAKAHKEILYHERHSSNWVLRLGDGTPESHDRTQRALDGLWKYTGELFLMDGLDKALAQEGVAPDLGPLEKEWEARVKEHLEGATLEVPTRQAHHLPEGRKGGHTEFLDHLLNEMQSVARAHPGARW